MPAGASRLKLLTPCEHERMVCVIAGLANRSIVMQPSERLHANGAHRTRRPGRDCLIVHPHWISQALSRGFQLIRSSSLDDITGRAGKSRPSHETPESGSVYSEAIGCLRRAADAQYGQL